MTVYAFGLEEHTYTGSGTLLSSTYYYSLAGRLIGALDGSGTTFYLTDALGSLLASFSNTANSAALKSNQLYGPYGTTRYTSGTLNTAKGFTGQYNDSLTGLDYYGARYYDPVVGVFLSADAVSGNGAGMNPYAYVGGNPETWNDPTGQFKDTWGGISAEAFPGLDIGEGGSSSTTEGSGATSPATTSTSEGGLSWSVTNGDTTTYYSADANGTVNYWVYRNGMLVKGGEQLPTDGVPIAANGAVLAAHGIKFHFSSTGQWTDGSQSGQGGISFQPHTASPTPQTGSGGQGIRPPRTPIAPPPGPNQPNSSGGIVTVRLDRSQYPETCAHIEDAINNGQPSVLTKDSDPIRNSLRRKAAQAGYPSKVGYHRDEYPLAMTLEGGAGADIRYINPADNSGAGSSIRWGLDPYPNGTQFTIECV